MSIDEALRALEKEMRTSDPFDGEHPIAKWAHDLRQIIGQMETEAHAIDQALTDPENQPSQWGTIPLSAIPSPKDDPFAGPMNGPTDHDEWTERGEVIGWNNCIAAIVANIRAPAQPPASAGDWLASFEAWATDRDMNIKRAKDHPLWVDGTYEDQDTQQAYHTWEAAIAASSGRKGGES